MAAAGVDELVPEPERHMLRLAVWPAVDGLTEVEGVVCVWADWTNMELREGMSAAALAGVKHFTALPGREVGLFDVEERQAFLVLPREVWAECVARWLASTGRKAVPLEETT